MQPFKRQRDSKVLMSTSIFSAAASTVDLLSTSDTSSSRELLRRIANHNRPHCPNVQSEALWRNPVPSATLQNSFSNICSRYCYINVAYDFHKGLEFCCFCAAQSSRQLPSFFHECQTRASHEHPFKFSCVAQPRRSLFSWALDGLTAQPLGTQIDRAVDPKLPTKLRIT
jgi:hypothetical protein